MREATVIHLDITGLRNEQNGAIEILLGSVVLNVNSLSSMNALDIRTQSATIGVRGRTQFAVYSTVSEDVLLSVTEGMVECRSDSGQVLFAVPDEAVEGSSVSRRWRNVSVSSGNVDSFRQRWLAERLAAMDVAQAIRSNAERYLILKQRFIQAYQRLMNERETIRKWINEDRLGTVGASTDQLREKRQIVGALLNIRAVQFFFEPVYYRLDQLLSRNPGLAGNTEIASGLSFRNFYRQFDVDSATLQRRMTEIRYVLKLYTLRNDGISPFDHVTSDDFLDENTFYDNDFFGN